MRVVFKVGSSVAVAVFDVPLKCAGKKSAMAVSDSYTRQRLKEAWKSSLSTQTSINAVQSLDEAPQYQSIV